MTVFIIKCKYIKINLIFDLNTSCLLQSLCVRSSLTLQETRSIHDSMNIQKNWNSFLKSYLKGEFMGLVVADLLFCSDEALRRGPHPE